ncbi:hypothetical protein CDAR_168451 [Caerostris darwini]|uniref:HTH CENPB-type domain-containing protein n=1 Tax=Caerostris darwini TaxID=1538125 RepID=A0AAV4T5K4_9ARAC|nr:hypothetical protein CDAR_168451 [Caerostris darwini]
MTGSYWIERFKSCVTSRHHTVDDRKLLDRKSRILSYTSRHHVNQITYVLCTNAMMSSRNNDERRRRIFPTDVPIVDILVGFYRN